MSAPSARASTTTTPARSTASSRRRITTAIAEPYGAAPGRRWLADRQRVGLPLPQPAPTAAPAVPAFRDWLEARYGTLEALNEAWGNVFWSQEYTDWSQIEPPNLTVAEPNPSHVLDFYRFASDVVDRVPGRAGRDPARALARPLDHAQLHDALLASSTTTEPPSALDFASWDSYPTRAGRALACPATRRRCAGRGPATRTSSRSTTISTAD